MDPRIPPVSPSLAGTTAQFMLNKPLPPLPDQEHGRLHPYSWEQGSDVLNEPSPAREEQETLNHTEEEITSEEEPEPEPTELRFYDKFRMVIGQVPIPAGRVPKTAKRAYQPLFCAETTSKPTMEEGRGEGKVAALRKAYESPAACSPQASSTASSSSASLPIAQLPSLPSTVQPQEHVEGGGTVREYFNAEDSHQPEVYNEVYGSYVKNPQRRRAIYSKLDKSYDALENTTRPSPEELLPARYFNRPGDADVTPKGAVKPKFRNKNLFKPKHKDDSDDELNPSRKFAAKVYIDLIGPHPLESLDSPHAVEKAQWEDTYYESDSDSDPGFSFALQKQFGVDKDGHQRPHLGEKGESRVAAMEPTESGQLAYGGEAQAQKSQNGHKPTSPTVSTTQALENQLGVDLSSPPAVSPDADLRKSMQLSLTLASHLEQLAPLEQSATTQPFDAPDSQSSIVPSTAIARSTAAKDYVGANSAESSRTATPSTFQPTYVEEEGTLAGAPGVWRTHLGSSKGRSGSDTSQYSRDFEGQAQSVSVHPFDRRLPPGAMLPPAGHVQQHRNNTNQGSAGSPSFNPRSDSLAYQRGEPPIIPTHGNLTSGQTRHLPRQGSGSGRNFPTGSGMQDLMLPERVSNGRSVTDPNEPHHKPFAERVMERITANSIGTSDRRPTIFAPGTPMQSLLLADRQDQLVGLYGMPRREFGGAISDPRFVRKDSSSAPRNLSERKGDCNAARYQEGSVVERNRRGDSNARYQQGGVVERNAAKYQQASRGVVARSERIEPHLQGRGAGIREHRSAGATGEGAETITQSRTTPFQHPPEVNIIAATPRLDDNFIPPLPTRPPPPPPTDAGKHYESFLASRLASKQIFKQPIVKMDRLQVRSPEYSTVKAKAIEDARQMQARVIEECKKTGKDPPPYGLVELIGKGSFGRVYMGKDMKSAAIVAVKIIDIDESDTLNPRLADSYSEFLKEVNALKILSENKAKNINHVIEALPVSQAMWMITEYCGGGSVATLMKPSAPGGLMEKWIIPILREVAEALKWVHQAGIIHRDIKCANVLITEQGGVQLCDFGVAGIIENKIDKRSTIIGTPYWMAPELFGENPSYGKEVDIWAFGAMTYEIATGYPPNAANGIPYERLGNHLKKNVPRLQGGEYSTDLRDMVAFLLEEVQSSRPTIEQIQKHKYIFNTGSTYPTTNLRSLVASFRMWESRGGDRKSLFMQHGAQGPSALISGPDEWNFSTTEAFDKKITEEFSTQDVYDAYGPSINFDEATARPNTRQAPKSSRRRPPPEALARLPAPLEKIFDPNTISTYDENSRAHYGKSMASASLTSDLPLRDDSAQTSIKDTMIDLGGHDSETGLSSFPDMDTIKASRRQEDNDDQYNSTSHDFSRPALSDPADINNNRRTQDWKFPSMPPASADPELSRFPPASYELPHPAVTPGSGGRPTLVHHPTEPVGVGAFNGMLGPTTSSLERMSMRESLIDLDMSMPDIIPEFRRPSTANSETSTHSEQMTSGNPFELERHTSQLFPPISQQGSDPAIYVSEESSVPTRLHTGNPVQDMAEMSDFSASDVEGPQTNGRARHLQQYDGVDDSEYHAMPPAPVPTQPGFYTMAHFPPLPDHPSVAALTGTASNAEMQDEIKRVLSGLVGQLSTFRDTYSKIEVPKRGSTASQKE